MLFETASGQPAHGEMAHIHDAAPHLAEGRIHRVLNGRRGHSL
jgi:hypothetical protein